MLSLGITAMSFFLMMITDIPSISPADVNGCSLPRAYGFPVPFVFYKEPFIQNSCYGYVVSVGLGGLATDLVVWLTIVLLLILSVTRLSKAELRPQAKNLRASWDRGWRTGQTLR